ncbi:glucanase B [Bisporella sp. PMI_857]|nr:glucanase B [Bisporella sp. PMI_857]
MGSCLSRARTTDSTLTIALENQTSSSSVYAYITGLAIEQNNAIFLLQADGKTPYYPTSPNTTGQPLAVNCGIKLGAPGSRILVQIPRLAGGRIWFCVNDTLTFLLNPGPGLVEPSASNTADPNYNRFWGFCEFTFNSVELFVNISYVDFVSLPIQLNLLNTSGTSQSVQGIPVNGLQSVVQALIAQGAKDGKGWERLIIRGADGNVLRALSPNTGIVMDGSLFHGLFTDYVNRVWSKYGTTSLKINTQAQWGTVSSTVTDDLLTFPGVGDFSRPSAKDIFSCSTGPFAVTSPAMGNIAARLAAAFNRSTLLIDGTHPDVEGVAQYYKEAATNHYSRILHEVETDGRGYAFPYDDVGSGADSDQSGSLADGQPSLLTVSVGGGSF